MTQHDPNDIHWFDAVPFTQSAIDKLAILGLSPESVSEAFEQSQYVGIAEEGHRFVWMQIGDRSIALLIVPDSEVEEGIVISARAETQSSIREIKARAARENS